MVEIHTLPGGEEPIPAAALSGLLDVDRAILLDTYGHDDFHEPASAWVEQLRGSAYVRSLLYLALADGATPETCAAGEVLGYAQVDLPLAEGAQIAEFFVGVRPGVRGGGVGRALYRAVDACATEHGRTIQQTWVFGEAVDVDDPRALLPESGAGALDGSTPQVNWLLRKGFVLEQAERHATLDLGDDPAALIADLAVWRHSAESRSGDDYELLWWSGPTPDHLRAAVAPLHAAMSTDLPSAGLTVPAEAWDAERVAVRDARNAARGRSSVSTIARHRGTGEVAALTELYWSVERPAGVWQEATLVLGRHRGHRLGMLVKVENLTRLVEVSPGARRVHTWNADENEYMLTINEALGFTTRGFEGAWERRDPTLVR